MAYSGLPASPTLTNPDMILPYEVIDSTPIRSDHSDPQRSWPASDFDFSIGPPLTQSAPLTPSTPIIYGNGTMLSDIGEVTEAESTPGKRTRPEEIREAVRNRDLALRSSPTMGYSAVMKRTKAGTHERKVSVESTSTITSHGQAAELFEDFDDSVSMDDSNFQGDDEESVFGDLGDIHKTHTQMQRDSNFSLDGEDMHSSAALSRRAEIILANAKKRLDTMEGNLTRAREGSLMHITPSSSISSINSSSPLARNTPSPPQGLVTALGVPSSRHRTLQNPGHSRISSENNLSSSTNRYFVRSASSAAILNEERVLPSKATTRYPVRSASAAAVLRDTTTRGSTDSFSSSVNHTSTRNAYATPLEPLGEDDTVSNLNSSRTSIAESYFSSVNDEYRALTRSTSSMQMRDLRDQMKDLRGKISSLRDRAREENMRRRSAQSLRTPSPFTAAEQWYTQGTAYDVKTKTSDEMDPSAWNGEPSPPLAVQSASISKPEDKASSDTDEENSEETPTREYLDEQESTFAVQETVQASNRDIEVTSREDSYDTANEDDVNEADDLATESGSDYGDEVVDYEELDGYPSESESFYHESSETPVSHEDREDAFDYQNFFLHSAMGAISRQGSRRDSVDSYSSDDSVATARGIAPPLPQNESFERPNSFHERKASQDSISTIDTFATANEDHEEDEADDSPDFNNFPTQVVSATRARSATPLIAKRDAFPEEVKAISPIRQTAGFVTPTSPPQSVSFNPQERIISPNLMNLQSYRKESVSSFSSSGTTRSFPLVKPKTPTQTPTPPIEEAEPPTNANLAVNAASQSIQKIVNSSHSSQNSVTVPKVNEYERTDSPHTAWSVSGSSLRQDSPVDMLAKEDQILVQGVVASLGKCVLSMQEVSRGGTEGRMWRRRLDLARRILEGDGSNGFVADI